jgi:hypothetical protein
MRLEPLSNILKQLMAMLKIEVKGIKVDILLSLSFSILLLQEFNITINY